MVIEETGLGIDKLKVVRRAVQDEGPEVEEGVVDEKKVKKKRRSSFLSRLWTHADEIGSFFILLAACVWLLAGLLIRHPLTIAIGVLFLIPSILAFAAAFKKAKGEPGEAG